MTRRLWYTLAGFLVFFGVALAQTQREDPQPGTATWWRVFNQFGQSYGVSYGTTRPTDPGPGEIFVDMDGDGDGGPVIEIYDSVNAEWNTYNDNDTASGAVSGTVNTIAKFDGAASVGDSSITDDGTTVDMTVADLTFIDGGIITGDDEITLTATGNVVNISTGQTLDIIGALSISAASGMNFVANVDFVMVTPAANDSIYDFVETIPITAAAQTTNFLDLSLTNADHTGGTVNGFNIGGITQDAQATENAFNIAAGWDNDINLNDTTAAIVQAADSTWTFTTPTANTSNLDFVATLAITAAAQTTNFIDLSLTNANHTGGTVNAFNIGAITGDAQATENAINLGSGWDSGIAFDDDLTAYATFENGNGALKKHTTAGYYYFPSGITGNWGPDGAGTSVASNVVNAVKVYIPARITVATIIFEVTTGIASALCEAGVYDDTGALLTVGTTIDCSTATVKTQDITDVTIGPGFYWIALTSNDGTVQFRNLSGTNDGQTTTFVNSGTVQKGTAANASVAGELPATLGVVSNSNIIHTMIKLQG